jgi:RNA polymerase sigma-70 factor (ECF subfamily)
MVRYAHGDGAAFGELFRRYERRVWGFLLRRTGSPEQADDLFQETFLRLHRFRDTFQPEGSFSHWLFQIARNVVIDHVRRGLRIRELSFPEELEPSTPADAELRTGTREELGILLRTLSDEQLGILLAAKGEGVCYVEVAGQVGKSVAAVKQTASRALRRLRATRLRQDA